MTLSQPQSDQPQSDQAQSDQAQSDQTRLSDRPKWHEACEKFSKHAERFKVDLEHLGAMPFGSPEQTAAWKLYVELSTRISVAHLRYRDGTEAAALKSLYELFLLARKLMGEYGNEAPAFTRLTSAVFENEVRHFTAKWHGKKENGLLERQDERRNFRKELRTLQSSLSAFAGMLETLVDSCVVGARVKHGPTLDKKSLWPETFIGPAAVRGETPSLEQELDRIKARRERAYSTEEEKHLGGLGPGDSGDSGDKESMGLVGLSLSGGGIRSATFCLGALQSLQDHGILRDVDYLSTVSGGGYLGTFLSTKIWENTSSDENVNYDETLSEILLPHAEGRTGDGEDVRWLRNNSKYLLPKTWWQGAKTGGRLILGALPFAPNLHSFYRKRLRIAYVDDGSQQGEPPLLLSQLAKPESPAPYPLLNAAVNLPGSKDPELRGRRSDFFLMSPLWVGSVLTGYCPTSEIEKATGNRLDLAAAMAISGAAVAPHMGTKKTNVFLRSLMVAVNASLAQWLPNPGSIAKGKKPWFLQKGNRLKEIWGNFKEDDGYVHLSDGGHIENLGLYELLRRRCKLIIAIDGECDPERAAGALIKVSRLAAIDLGVEIKIDLADIAIDEQQHSQTHWAFGTIDYGHGETGYLVYLKSSLTGNEPDYVKQYHRNHPTFPHQTTADQFFDEDQFEAYRALGRHSMDDLFGPDLITKNALAAQPFRSQRWLKSLVRELLPLDSGD